MSSENYNAHNGLTVADNLLQNFVGQFKQFYKRNLAYNVHGLLHIADCVRQYGKLDNFSAYKYENAILKLQHKMISPLPR